MSTLTTGLTIAEAVRLGVSLWMMLGKTNGMSDADLDKIHKDIRAEFDKTDPEELIEQLKEKMK